MKNKKILFICKHNRFRSKIAEAYFNKINKNKKIKAISGGIIKGIPIAKNVIDFGKKNGLRINKQTRGLDEAELEKIDKIIIVADNIPPSLFKRWKKKLIVLKIPDCSQNDKKRIEKISKLIMKKVDKFAEELK